MTIRYEKPRERQEVPDGAVALCPSPGRSRLAVSWLAWNEHVELLTLRESTRDLDAAGRRDRNEIQRLRRQVAAIERVAKTPPAPAAAATPAVSTPRPPVRPIVDLGEILRKDPAYAELHRRMMLRNIRRIYGDLSQLGLPPDQLQKLTDLLIDQMSARNDAWTSVRELGLKEGTPEFRAAEGQAYRLASTEATDAIKAMLGPDGYQDLQTLRDTTQQRNLVIFQLDPELTSIGQPLTASQIDALAQARVANRKTPPQARQQALNLRAEQVLSPGQYQAFIDQQALQTQWMQLQQRAMKTAREQNPGVHSFRLGGF